MNTTPTKAAQHGILLALALSIIAITKATSAEAPPSKEQKKAEAKQPGATAPKAAGEVKPEPSRKILVFRNVRSWNRKVDFEEVLTDLGFQFDVKSSAEMEDTDLSPYGVVIIPGAQHRDDFYRDYAANAARINGYVTNGGTLVLELNGAERDGITLPLGVRMVRHGARDNAILMPEHPVLLPLSGKPIHANYASHGYLEAVPKDAAILVTEMSGEQPIKEMPTFIEYVSGKGRVLAACQCFHDQDNSGRGPLMPALVSYAVEREWYSAKK